MIQEVVHCHMPTTFGSFEMYVFKDDQHREHIALVCGDVQKKEHILIRIHSECMTGDLLGSYRCDCQDQLHEALRLIAEHKNGILLYLRQEGRGIGLLNKLKAYQLQDKGLDTVEANVKLGFAPDDRDYGIAADMLKYLDIHSVRILTNNPEKIKSLEKHGILVQERVSLLIEHKMKQLPRYFIAKKNKLNHIIP